MRSMERGRMARRLLVLIGVGLCLTTVVSSHPSASAADPPHTLSFGAFAQPQGNQSQQQAVQQLETQIGRKLETVRVFKTWTAAFPDSFDTWLKAGDRTLIMSIKPSNSSGRIPWASLATAAPGSTLDTQMRTWARKVRDFGVPIYISFHHEPESAGTSPGTSADFIAAWRHWVDIFREEGATNAKFMLINTDYSYEVATSDRRSAPKWYPGDAWVDAMAIDAYNWYTCRPSSDNAWRTLANIVEPFRAFGALHPTVDLWLTEWATGEDPANGARKSQWIDQARALFATPAYSQFKGVSYFDSNAINPDFPNCLWYVDTSTASLASFKAMANDPLYSGDAMGDNPVPVPAPPVAAFTPACTDLSCTFTDSSTDSDGTITSRLWDFGDNTSSTETSPQHTYGGEGPYHVVLTVTDNDLTTGTISHDISVAIAPPAAPVAAFSSVCTGLSCTFTDASTDSDGTITSRSWEFDDTTNSTTTSPQHTFPADGTYHVSLTVTDDDLQTNNVIHDVTVAVVPPSQGPVFRASNSANTTGTAASVTVPGSVVSGDQLVLVVTANLATTASTPAGWTLLGTQSDGTPDMRSWVFTRVATANTRNSTVTSTLGASGKSSRILLAYSGAGTPTATSVVQGPSSASHATPAATVAVGSRVIAYWSEKSNDATGWTLPAQVQSRSTSIGTSTGRINAATGDATSTATSWPASTATSTSAS
ncbi:MAG: domain containing protein, partial [Ilumatobacteraceae bacterium]|nr:domain containing protein [Ilumatobacteraceae bacterium]